jgi:hypothetical protein
MTVKELLQRIDATELTEWRAYYQLEPFGQDRADYPASIVAHTVAVCNGAKDSNPSDFMPKFGAETARRATDAEMFAKAKAFAARFQAFGGGRK